MWEEIMLYKRWKFGNRKALTYCLSGIILCSVSVILFYIEGSYKESSILDVIGIIISMVGTMLIVFQLWDSKDITCCDMLAEMNCRFSDNEKILKLYQKLEEQYRIGVNSDSTKTVSFDDISISDVMAYCSFFEVLYEYVEHNIISIKQMDDLFGYRFFIFVHSKYIQEHELFAVPSSYANIYRLYAKWSKYRRDHSVKVGLVVDGENAIPTEYLSKELYLEERLYQDYEESNVPVVINGNKQVLLLKRLSLGDYDKVKNLLNRISKIQKDYKVINKLDYQESVLVDYAYGMFCEEKLVAVCICVLNRKTKRNFGYRFASKRYQNVITVEVLEWDSEYSDVEFETIFNNYLMKVKRKLHVSTICYRKCE